MKGRGLVEKGIIVVLGPTRAEFPKVHISCYLRVYMLRNALWFGRFRSLFRSSYDLNMGLKADFVKFCGFFGIRPKARKTHAFHQNRPLDPCPIVQPSIKPERRPKVINSCRAP